MSTCTVNALMVTVVITTVITTVTATVIAYQTGTANTFETTQPVLLTILVLMMLVLRDWIGDCHSCARKTRRRVYLGGDAITHGLHCTTAVDRIGKGADNYPRDKHYHRYDQVAHCKFPSSFEAC
jgi:hypothetical protein